MIVYKGEGTEVAHYLVPRERASALFDAIAARDKRLHANPGAHAAVPGEEIRNTEAFLARYLRPGVDAP